MKELDSTMAYWARWYYARLAVPLQVRARELGYNLITHGSLRRDIDLVAVPWVAEAVSAADLVQALVEVVAKVIPDGAKLHDDGNHPLFGQAIPQQSGSDHEAKPHGRVAYSISLGGTWLDLSITPRVVATDIKATTDTAPLGS